MSYVPLRPDPDVRWLALILVLLVLASATGCEAKRYPVDPDDADVIAEQFAVNGVRVYAVRLADGTRCVVTEGHYSGGVDCDWVRP